MSLYKRDVIQGIQFDVTMTLSVSDDNQTVSAKLDVKASNNNLTNYKIVFVSGKVISTNGRVVSVDSDIQKLWGRIHALGRKRNAFKQTVSEVIPIDIDSIDISTNDELKSLDQQIKAKASQLSSLKVLLQGQDPTTDAEYMKVSNELTDLKTQRQRRIGDITKSAIRDSLTMDIQLTVR